MKGLFHRCSDTKHITSFFSNWKANTLIATTHLWEIGLNQSKQIISIGMTTFASCLEAKWLVSPQPSQLSTTCKDLKWDPTWWQTCYEHFVNQMLAKTKG
jgi:hypothetical protein